MKIDERTGLPELPKGYFWRVEDEGLWLRLKIYRKWLLGLRRGYVLGKTLYRRKYDAVADGWYDAFLRLSDPEGLIRTSITEAGTSLANDLRVDIEADKTIRRHGSLFIGNYPPKTLSTPEEESN